MLRKYFRLLRGWNTKAYENYKNTKIFLKINSWWWRRCEDAASKNYTSSVVVDAEDNDCALLAKEEGHRYLAMKERPSLCQEDYDIAETRGCDRHQEFRKGSSLIILCGPAQQDLTEVDWGLVMRAPRGSTDCRWRGFFSSFSSHGYGASACYSQAWSYYQSDKNAIVINSR